MSFRSLDDIIAFQGPDYERCYVPDAARDVLKRWDLISQHYELEDARSYE
ncbi:acyl-CoA dehydrogenase [Labrenzia sp. R5_0]|nr:acyl-CoA dehydrogenase [Labrenzia sp. R5_0]